MLASAVRWDSSSSTTRTRVADLSISIHLYCASQVRRHAMMLGDATASVAQIHQIELRVLPGAGGGHRRVSPFAGRPRYANVGADGSAGGSGIDHRGPPHSAAASQTSHPRGPSALRI